MQTYTTYEWYVRKTLLTVTVESGGLDVQVGLVLQMSLSDLISQMRLLSDQYRLYEQHDSHLMSLNLDCCKEGDQLLPAMSKLKVNHYEVNMETLDVLSSVKLFMIEYGNTQDCRALLSIRHDVLYLQFFVKGSDQDMGLKVLSDLCCIFYMWNTVQCCHLSPMIGFVRCCHLMLTQKSQQKSYISSTSGRCEYSSTLWLL